MQFGVYPHFSKIFVEATSANFRYLVHMKQLPIGIQDFKVLREGNYIYVDKTEHIHRLATTGKYYFLSRPRRFGKSLLLTTIRDLYAGRKSLFEGLWIEDHWD